MNTLNSTYCGVNLERLNNQLLNQNNVSKTTFALNILLSVSSVSTLLCAELISEVDPKLYTFLYSSTFSRQVFLCAFGTGEILLSSYVSFFITAESTTYTSLSFFPHQGQYQCIITVCFYATLHHLLSVLYTWLLHLSPNQPQPTAATKILGCERGAAVLTSVCEKKLYPEKKGSLGLIHLESSSLSDLSPLFCIHVYICTRAHKHYQALPVE